MHGKSDVLDTQWGVIWEIMQATGWSWSELTATPWPLVVEAINHISAERHWQSVKMDMDRQMSK